MDDASPKLGRGVSCLLVFPESAGGELWVRLAAIGSRAAADGWVYYPLTLASRAREAGAGRGAVNPAELWASADFLFCGN